MAQNNRNHLEICALMTAILALNPLKQQVFMAIFFAAML